MVTVTSNMAGDGLRLLVIGMAMSHGYSFTPRCFLDISDMIAMGIWDLKKGDTVSSEEMRNAQTALVNIVSAMVIEAAQQGKNELEESIFDVVRRSLCPLPPWFKEPCPR
jgi:hypothetical protein